MVWSAWPEYQPLRPAVEATPRLYAVLGTEGWRKDSWELDDFLHGFLEDYPTEARNVAGLWDEAVSDRLFSNLAASIERKGYSVGARAVLQHVEVRPPSRQLELITNYNIVEPDPYGPVTAPESLRRIRFLAPSAALLPENACRSGL